MMEITKNSLAVFLTESLVADLSDAAFGKSSAVYGHIDENGSSVHKRLARKMTITDKMGKNSRLSVNLSAILDKSVEQHCIQKSRTKSVANRLPSFSFSFNSNKKRDFFPSLFFIFFDNQPISILQNRYYRLFL